MSVKLAQYVYHFNTFHLLKTEGVNQTKGNRGHIQNKKQKNPRNLSKSWL